MKRIALVLLLCFALILTACSGSGSSGGNVGSNSVKNQEMTLELGIGSRTGTYTGPVNENGLPEGHGSFTSQNSQGDKWTYTGEFVNGVFEGEGKTEWEDGYAERGTYHNGELVPLDLSGSIYKKILSDPDSYEGYTVEFVAEIFNVIGYDDDGYIHFQAYQDIENNDNTVYVYTYPETDVEDDDYVKLYGIIDGIYEGENMIGGKITNVVVGAYTCEKMSYIDAVSPTLKEVVVNETQTQYGYSVTVEKVEFAKAETRVYIKIENNGANKFNLYEWNAEIVQDGKQYGYESNWDADYPEISNDLRPGTSSEGIILFPALDQKDFTLYLDGSSDNWREDIEEMQFDISVN